jgi:hypothetical protein
MGRKLFAAVIVVLVLGAGAAVAAVKLGASSVTTVCVNDTNGLMRAASTCREGEHAATVGGGSSVQVTQNGTFTVAEGETGAGKALPLTGVTVSGRCQATPSPFPGLPDGIVAQADIQAASGTTMDVFPTGSIGSPVGRSSATIGGFGAPPGISTGFAGTATAVLTSNGATATIIVGEYGDPASKTCTFLWQAVENPN